jgi:hypothetical protein
MSSKRLELGRFTIPEEERFNRVPENRVTTKLGQTSAGLLVPGM